MEFIVVGKIQPKQRPRFKRCGAFVRTYTQQATLDYEGLVAKRYIEKYGELKLNGALAMEINAYFNVPKSLSKKKKAELYGKPNTAHRRGDIDNVAKSVLDGLNGIAYDDDKVVYDLHVRKLYVSSDDDLERIEVKIYGNS